MSWLKKWKNLYDIGSMPTWVRLWAEPLAWVVAVPFVSYAYLGKYTTRKRLLGEPSWLAARGVIFCHWHAAIPAAQQVFDFRSMALLFHPKWYMLPVYRLFQCLGCRTFVFGSSGHQGREAAAKLQALIAAGFNTVVNPDGPAGPPKAVKPGLYHLANATNAPVVPVIFSASRRYVSGAWDEKYFPYPWSTIEVRIGEPLMARDFADAKAFSAELTRRLGP